MKIAFTYLLLFTYASIMLKPVMPLISDALAHTLNYSGHMATVHQHNGKFHVHNEFIEASKKTTDNKNDLQKKNNTEPEHLFFCQEIILHYTPAIAISFTPFTTTCISSDPSSDSPPPRLQTI